MPHALATIRVLGRGRARPLLLWPPVSALVVFAISLLALTPAFAALERAHHAAAAPPSVPAAPIPGPPSPPNFTIGIGSEDEPTKMPAIQSAMTDTLAFSDQFADFLEHGGSAPHFGTQERVLSPTAARKQVGDGTSVLALILPPDLTPTIMSDIRRYRAGAIDAPTYTITIVAGPQALAEDSFILREYRSQVITQAVERVSEQIRTVASKSDCQSMRITPCMRSQDETVTAFEAPFAITVDTVAGPEPITYFGESATTVAPAASPTASVTSMTAPDPRPASPLVWMASVLASLVIASAVLALAASVMVNRSAGLQLVVFGPWRSLTPQRPFSRRSLFEAKLGIGALGCTGLVVAALGALLVLSPLFGAGLGLGAHPALRLVAAIGFLVLLSAATTATVLAVNDGAGSGFAALAAVLGAGIGLSTSGIGFAIGLSGTSGSAGVLHGLTTGSLSQLAPSGAISMIIALSVLCITSVVAGWSVTGAYDSRVSTQISFNDR